jgi:hypothetical protein
VCVAGCDAFRRSHALKDPPRWASWIYHRGEDGFGGVADDRSEEGMIQLEMNAHPGGVHGERTGKKHGWDVSGCSDLGFDRTQEGGLLVTSRESMARCFRYLAGAMVPGGTKLLSGREDGGWLTASLGCSFEPTRTTQDDLCYVERIGGTMRGVGFERKQNVRVEASFKPQSGNLAREASCSDNSRALLSAISEPLSYNICWNSSTACGRRGQFSHRTK